VTIQHVSAVEKATPTGKDVVNPAPVSKNTKRVEEPTFDFYMIEVKPVDLIGDRTYDSDELDENLKRNASR
jgi:hypothetical protein